VRTSTSEPATARPRFALAPPAGPPAHRLSSPLPGRRRPSSGADRSMSPAAFPALARASCRHSTPSAQAVRAGADGLVVEPVACTAAARGRSTSAAVFRTSGPADSSRAAVTAATSSRRLDPERSERVDGGPGSQSLLVCGPSAARLANTPAAVAVGAASFAGATGTAARLHLTDLHGTPQFSSPHFTPSRLGAVRTLDRRTGPNRLTTERTHAS
jgi:hypothetical protein